MYFILAGSPMFMNGGVRKILAMFILNDAMVIFTE